MKTIVFWRVNKEKRFDIHSMMNVNGESEYNVDGTKLEGLRELEHEGIIQIRKK